MNIWVIDFEASGLSKKSYPIEVGITNGIDNYNALIKPMSHWSYWEEKAEIIHNIPLNEVMRNGKDSLSVANELNNLLKNSIVYCDNIQWDGFWLNVLFSDNGLSPTFKILDIQDILKTGRQWRLFESKMEELEISNIYKKHRALDDAKAIWSSLKYALV